MSQNTKRRVIFFAPYRQCESALYASAMASFIIKKTVDIRKYDFEYITLDKESDYCSPLIEHCVHRILSPNEFKAHLSSYTPKGEPIKAKAVYWFDYNKQYLQHSLHCQNYFFADYTKWDWERMQGTKHFAAVMYGAENVARRMRLCLTNCYANHAIYASSFRTVAPLREDLVDSNRIKLILSMCSIKNPQNRLEILTNVRKLVAHSPDLFVTLLMDGRKFTGEQEIIDQLGAEYSGKCLVLESFSDYEYLNLLRQHDMFFDLNPVNGIGYLLTAALHQGLLVGGYDQMLYRDILNDGKFGVLVRGDRKEYGYEFDRVVPNWTKLFALLYDKILTPQTMRALMQRRNDCPSYQQTVEQRIGPFLDMWQYYANLKMPCYSFPND